MELNRYRLNKARAVFINTEPTLTDQAGAGETDINVIIKKYGITGIAPGSSRQPMYGDFTEIPQDLAEIMELAKSAQERRSELPPQLQGLTLPDLLALTPEQLANILAPPKPATEPKGDEPK